MIRINLLPLEYQKKTRSFSLPNRVSLIVYGAVFALLLACATSYYRQSDALMELKLRADIVAQEETRLAAQSRAIEKLEMRTAMLGERMQLLGNLQNKRFENVSWLNAMNTVIPEKLWVIQASRNSTGSHTTVEGVSEGYRPIAKLMQSMEGTGHFGSVQLMEAKRQPGVGSASIHFTVTAGWSPEPAKGEK